MHHTIRASLMGIAAIGLAIGLTACDDATIASQNLSSDADNFKITRKVTFINGITDNILLEVTGRCAIEADAADAQLEVVCKTDTGEFVKHFLGVSDNVTYTVEQLVAAEVSASQYKFVVKPLSLIPNLEIR